MHKTTKRWKSQFTKMRKRWKSICELPLRMRYHVFGLRIGSRGTPWNWKTPGPGGSENAKCQKVPFIWHFGLFQVLVFFHFSLLHFLLFHFFLFFDFLVLLILSLFHFLHFLTFSCFVDFDEFWSIFNVVMIFSHFLSLIYVPQWWHTFLLAYLHSHYPPFW